MREFLEEYGGVLTAVLVASILLSFLYWGCRNEGWLGTWLVGYAGNIYGG